MDYGGCVDGGDKMDYGGASCEGDSDDEKKQEDRKLSPDAITI